ncbi:hypothetical protein [Streptomyces wuyuanensis]|uniref:hypothetical protein n=1 Tax=Streptomyces wuyuanensis TaxID=1196353 RepID=UPI00341364CE
MSAPAIPAACAHHPTQGGLVVPYVSFEHNGLPVFGGLDPDKRTRAFENDLCQIRERPLGQRYEALTWWATPAPGSDWPVAGSRT